MRIRIPYLLVLTLGALGLFYGTSSPGLNASPTISITTLENTRFDLASPGRARVVSFYSPDCPFSRRSTAGLNTLHQRFGKDNVDVIAVAMPYDDLSGITDFKQKHEIEYNLAHDEDGTIATSFPNVLFTPTTFLLDTQGKIIWRHTGKLDSEMVSDQISRAVLK